MTSLYDGNGKITGLNLTGKELQRIEDVGLLKRARSYQVASVKKEYGGGYNVWSSTATLEAIRDFLVQDEVE